MKANYCILLAMLFLGCFHTRTSKERYAVKRCSLCDSLLRKNIHLTIPLRPIHRNAMSIPLIPHKDGTVIKPDTMRVLTGEEATNVNNLLFCFIGKSEEALDNYFQISDTITLPLSRSKSDDFSKTYYFYAGSYSVNGTVVSDKEAQNQANAKFHLIQSSAFNLKFHTDHDKTIFTGTHRDSVNLKNCLERK